ncbi:DUF6344 domain-containing protein [Streptomyces sp. NPDC050211]|uniref:DUF6344 domain-containing protein n=1 Tax=Streptomyces sp. NPDC050211 TaxID=3154932 RepID=UPI003441FE2A
MARNKVMKLWTAIVTAFLALCTALGFATTTANAAVPQSEAASDSVTHVTAPPIPWAWSRSLPPTMKQRIRAEAHGKSPSCRHRPQTDTVADAALEAAALCDPAEPLTLLQR